MIYETERLICRDFEIEDFEAIHDYASNSEVVRYMVWGPNTIDETKQFMKESIAAVHKMPRRRYELAIVDKSSGQVVGAIALYILGHMTGEIGYSIRPSYWHRGYATEAARGILIFGFQSLKLNRIQGTCDIRNRGSAHVLSKVGMTKEGVLREHMMLRDGLRSSFMFSILKREFVESKG